MSDKLKVVLYWHMHQPEYRDLRNGEYQLPWTYLHTIKDYVDMAAHLEAEPKAKAVINFAPTLLEQIDDYANQIRGFLEGNTALRDPLLASLVEPALPSQNEQRIKLIKDCLRANEDRLIKRFPAYKRLAEMAPWLLGHPDALFYLDEQYLVDLLVWHHLAWMGETVRITDPRISRLIKKEAAYTLDDRHELLQVIGGLIYGVIGRYKKLAESGQIEISVTPYAHPIMPLLLDIKSTCEAMPDAKLPLLEKYPGGEERVRWHLMKGIETFEHFFGFKPKGCWPSEGGLSEATIRLLPEFGFKWTASGGSVLHNSLKLSNIGEEMMGQSCLGRPYQLEGTELSCFFRDDGLSDLIGFTYSDWHADDAVANLIEHLENIADACDGRNESVLSIILDGENAWEYYPKNGYYFLSTLYKKLSSHPDLELTTFSECIEQNIDHLNLPRLVAGSWVYGTFSTWIGDPDKNRGWDMLGDAKHCFDRVVSSGRLSADRLAEAELQLAVCEGSDWFWWFGDYNSAESVSDFEHLFRKNLSHLYQLMGEKPPDYLTHSFTHGSGAPALGGTMRPGQDTEG